MLTDFVKKIQKKYFSVFLLIMGSIFLLCYNIQAAAIVKKIDLGGNSSAAVSDDNRLWCWGCNDGQLGDGTKTDRNTPVCILKNIKMVSMGSAHAAAVTCDGTLYCWGDNRYGQIGDGTLTQRLKPVKVMTNVVAASVGGYHTAAITSDGSLWCWGANQYGQLGNGDTSAQKKPVKIMSGVSSVSLGTYHSAAIKRDGSLWCWGNNNYGAVGNGSTFTQKKPVKIMNDVKSVSLDFLYSAAVKTNGSLWCWGNNNNGQLGDGSTKNSSVPVQIMTGVSSVELGGDYSAAVKNDGSLWTWGDNAQGQLGNGSVTRQMKPCKIMDNVIKASLGDAHGAAIKADGSLWCWGNNKNGQLGDGSFLSKYTPVKISVFAGLRQYTVRFDANGGTGAPSSQTKTEGSTLILSSKTPKRTNYTFEGWSENKNAASPSYYAGGKYTTDKNVTLYAVWKKNQTISVNSSITKTYKAGGTFSLNAKAKTRLSYKSSASDIVSVSSSGKVTIRGYGKAVITVYAAETSAYNSTSKKVTVTIIPRKLSCSVTNISSRSELLIKWTSDNTVTGYEVQISNSSKFPKSSTYINREVKSKGVMRRMTYKFGKATYYVRVRSYRTVKGGTVTGPWSNTAKITIK